MFEIVIEVFMDFKRHKKNLFIFFAFVFNRSYYKWLNYQIITQFNYIIHNVKTTDILLNLLSNFIESDQFFSLLAGKFTSNYKITIGADFAIKTLDWDPLTKINLQLWYCLCLFCMLRTIESLKYIINIGLKYLISNIFIHFILLISLINKSKSTFFVFILALQRCSLNI